MTIIKICGLKDVESATVALDSGADLVGMIMVPGRARTIDPKVAKQITSLCSKRQKISSIELLKSIDSERWVESVYGLIKNNGPYAVGVFRNQSVEEINDAVTNIGLEFVNYMEVNQEMNTSIRLKSPL
ncbi:N-(5'-phosphoribosyl)anthranilate isomerase [Cyberlindnera fabianii]|uniref:N-(5'-phosphoribosyl)anthranilate isomerase n=1 Tax=Cyberlindnera fabianii TaxID=36022 RepID=A0A1V2KZS2_CYBFA|nr:N-(5'-phosphoribosyl)anthranilate isomerase [Cyberlindnera fabianii]